MHVVPTDIGSQSPSASRALEPAVSPHLHRHASVRTNAARPIRSNPSAMIELASSDSREAETASHWHGTAGLARPGANAARVLPTPCVRVLAFGFQHHLPVSPLQSAPGVPRRAGLRPPWMGPAPASHRLMSLTRGRVRWTPLRESPPELGRCGCGEAYGRPATPSEDYVNSRWTRAAHRPCPTVPNVAIPTPGAVRTAGRTTGLRLRSAPAGSPEPSRPS